MKILALFIELHCCDIDRIIQHCTSSKYCFPQSRHISVEVGLKWNGICLSARQSALLHHVTCAQHGHLPASCSCMPVCTVKCSTGAGMSLCTVQAAYMSRANLHMQRGVFHLGRHDCCTVRAVSRVTDGEWRGVQQWRTRGVSTTAECSLGSAAALLWHWRHLLRAGGFQAW